MLKLMEPPPAVIFTTAFDDYAIKAFEAHAIDYLLKPFSKDRFDKAVQKWLTQKTPSKNTQALLEATSHPAEEQHRIVVKKGANIVIITVHKVHYVEAYDDYVKIHTAEGFYLK